MNIEQELDFYRREYYRMLDFIPVGVVAVSYTKIRRDKSRDEAISFQLGYINLAFSKLTGYTIDDLSDSNSWFEKLYPDIEYRYERQQSSNKFLSNLHLPIQEIIQINCKNGESKWFETFYKGTESMDIESNIFYVIFVPIDNFKRTIYDLEIKGRLDYLTELPNRRGLLEALAKNLVNINHAKKSFILVMADIDNFKKINDQYGHSCGDFVLQKIAKNLKRILRESDLISRWGGEEFLMVFPYSDISTVKGILVRIQEYLRDNPINWKDIILSVTLTFGVAENSDNTSFAKTCEDADHALYQGKRSGRNRIVVYE